jgi:hypothetical protein
LFLKHASGAGGAAPRGWWPRYFICFVFISFHFILVYFHNTHQVLEGLGGVATLYYVISF